MLMPTPTRTTETAAAVTSYGGLDFVLTAKPHPLWKKDKVDVSYHAPPAPSSAR